MGLTQRLATALGIGTTQRASSEAQAVVTALLPNTMSQPPERGVTGMLQSYNNSPWVRAVTSRISVAVGSTSWQVYAIKNQSGKFFRHHELQSKGVKRLDFKRKGIDVPEGTELVEIPEHPALELLSGGCYRMPGSISRQMTQLYLELSGEAFWLLEPRNVNGATVPVGFWVIPPTWIADVPTKEDGFYVLDSGQGKTVNIPAPMMMWFTNPSPVNPYGRGVGHMRAFGDEIDTDEYTAKYIRSFFYNSARPDLLIYGKDLHPEDVQRLEIGWLQKVRGFLQAHRPFFLNRDVTVKELTYKFAEMQMIELRKWERDILVNGRGVPPEVLGIVENSNRATISAAYYLFGKGVIEPALEFLRNMLQSELMPMYDQRLILGYDSPVEEDYEFQLKAMQAAPWTVTINEWRAVQGLDAKEYGDQHVFPLAQKPVDLTDPTAFEVIPIRTAKALPEGFAEGLQVTADCECGVDHSQPLDRSGAHIHRNILATPPKAIQRYSRDNEKQIGGEPAINLAERLGPQMTSDLLAAWEEISNSIAMDEVLAALKAGDVNAAIALIDNLEVAEALEPARQSLREAMFVVGQAAAEEVADFLGVSFSFDISNPAVLQELESAGASLIKYVDNDTKDLIKKILVDGYERGASPGAIAKEIRGVVGLTERDYIAGKKLEADLLASGMPQAEVDVLVNKFIIGKIKARADTIALNELVYSANRGQEMIWEAAADAGIIDKKTTMRIWLATGDERMCELCGSADGSLAPIGGAFPNGFETPNDIHILCRCSEGLVFG